MVGWIGIAFSMERGSRLCPIRRSTQGKRHNNLSLPDIYATLAVVPLLCGLYRCDKVLKMVSMIDLGVGWRMCPEEPGLKANLGKWL